MSDKQPVTISVNREMWKNFQLLCNLQKLKPSELFDEFMKQIIEDDLKNRMASSGDISRLQKLENELEKIQETTDIIIKNLKEDIKNERKKIELQKVTGSKKYKFIEKESNRGENEDETTGEQ